MMALSITSADTIRWADLVRQARNLLPVVAPGWTDQNVSDPGIAVIELLSWLVETTSYRTSVIDDRQRRALLALLGYPPLRAEPARCLVVVRGTPGSVGAGVIGTTQRDRTDLAITLEQDVNVTGARVATAAWVGPTADHNGYTSDSADISRELAVVEAVPAFGPDPRPGSALVIGLTVPTGQFPAGPLDLWLGVVDPASGAGPHHDVVTGWQVWTGSTWLDLSADDPTGALSRAGRVRITLPATPTTHLGDQTTGIFAGLDRVWLRLVVHSGQHDAAPRLQFIHADCGTAIVGSPTTDVLPIGIDAPVFIEPGARRRATVALSFRSDGLVTALHLAVPGPGDPVVDVWKVVPPTTTTLGSFAADLAVAGICQGIPNEVIDLPGPLVGTPQIWLSSPGQITPVPIVDDLAVVGPTQIAAEVTMDGTRLLFGDGRQGSIPAAGTTVLVTGLKEGPVRTPHPPLPLLVADDVRTQGLAPNGAVTMELVAGLTDGRPAEDVMATAARVQTDLWAHDRLVTVTTRPDELPADRLAGFGVPERVVTGPDLERRALAVPGTAIRRVRAIAGADPRAPHLHAEGCISLVVLPELPLAKPEPSQGLRAAVFADLEPVRPLGSRLFVIGPEYVSVDIGAHLVLNPDADLTQTIAAADNAIRRWLHPLTGGPSGHGWPFGRTVRRTDLWQVLDGVPGVNRAQDVTLARCGGGCADITLCAYQLPLAGVLSITGGMA